eukprot:SAG31_NODE_556_length_14161_cov_3.384943_1_plen_160_part_00
MVKEVREHSHHQNLLNATSDKLNTVLVHHVDADALAVLDHAAKELEGKVKVAVVDYTMIDWKCRQAWTILPSLVPTLRLFSVEATVTDAMSKKLPHPISGLDKTAGEQPNLVEDLSEAQVRGQAWRISHAVLKIVSDNPDGGEGKLKSKSEINNIRSEL